MNHILNAFFREAQENSLTSAEKAGIRDIIAKAICFSQAPAYEHISVRGIYVGNAL